MTTSQIQEVLDAIREIAPTSMAARLRPLLPEIDRKLAEGVSLSAVQAVLKKIGFDVSASTLGVYVSRYRRGQRASARRDVAGVGRVLSPDAKPAMPSQFGSGADAQSLASSQSGQPLVAAEVSAAGVVPLSAPTSSTKSSDPTASSTSSAGEAVSMQDFARLLRPDPAKTSEESQRYKRMARTRGRTSGGEVT